MPGRKNGLVQIELDLYNLFHNIKLKILFGDRDSLSMRLRDSVVTLQDTSLRKPSSFSPVFKNPAVDTFIKKGITDIRQSNLGLCPPSNNL